MTPKRIFLVDDHQQSADALARLLRSDGHSVSVAHSFADALIVAARLPAIDVLVSDIGLPDGNGCDLLRLVRDRADGGPGTAIALTGHGEEHWAEECRRAGFDRFIIKPVEFSELAAAIVTDRATGPSGVAAPDPMYGRAG